MIGLEINKLKKGGLRHVHREVESETLRRGSGSNGVQSPRVAFALLGSVPVRSFLDLPIPVERALRILWTVKPREVSAVRLIPNSVYRSLDLAPRVEWLREGS